MKEIDTLFFELIRVSIGTSDDLSRKPDADEWSNLYKMAQKQSLVGICFAGVQRLCDSEREDYYGMSELQYLTWMGMATKIQQRNEVVNKQCVELQRMLTADGFQSCVLKGQGNATLYPEHLRVLRQAGDIDVWIDASRERILNYVNSISSTDDAGELHVGLHIFKNTEVEVHFTPSIASRKKTDRLLQDWFESKKSECFNHSCSTDTNFCINLPSIEFNLVYLMHHIYRHYLFEGIGLRQILDYYFVLSRSVLNERKEAMKVIRNLKMDKFAGALMYVMRTLFDIDEDYLICPIDVKRGSKLLEVIMEGGNFGHGTKKFKVVGWDKPWSRLSRYVRRNWYMLQDYPDEIIGNVLKKFNT